MKTKIIKYDEDFFKLAMDIPAVKDAPVLAVFTAYEGTDVFTIDDVRLSQYAKPNHYFCSGAEKHWDTFLCKSEDHASEIRSYLQETFTPKEGSKTHEHNGPMVHWCTYDGIVRGRLPDEMPYNACFMQPKHVYHTRDQAHAYLKQLQEFWSAQPIDVNDPDALQKASDIKVKNPYRQKSSTEISFEIKLKFLKENQDNSKSSLKP